VVVVPDVVETGDVVVVAAVLVQAATASTMTATVIVLLTRNPVQRLVV
jgi:orotate phosphoribosyltransferase